jgi:parallel beta-helix repeat protein
MKGRIMIKKTIHQGLTLVLLITVSSSVAISQDSKGVLPIADAGFSRYVAHEPIVLDGTGSYDPDDSGPLSYRWRQIAGPSVVIIDANTATPTIGRAMQPGTGRDTTPELVGFYQTDEVQECVFELVVNDGEYNSLADTVKVVIVPDFGDNTLELVNDQFDPNKPTFVFFSGGSTCADGGGDVIDDPMFLELVNHIGFPQGYNPDPTSGPRTFYKYANMIIVFLSSVAPNYQQLIQTCGFSAGGMPALDVGAYMNLTYVDPRYAVNRVTLMDGAFCLGTYGQPLKRIEDFTHNPVGDEPCWIENYAAANKTYYPDVLNVSLPLSHIENPQWYFYSFLTQDENNFNGGLVAGVYWSVFGPGKNLNPVLTLDPEPYKFQWRGSVNSGYMDFFDEQQSPGRFPEPVRLIGPEDGAFVDANGAVFSCEESENAVGYQLLFGPDPYRVMDYYVVSDTPVPPTEVIRASFFKQTWWTIKVRDLYGSTIYADPIRVEFENMEPAPIENITIGKAYGSIQRALNDARNGDEIVVSPGVYQAKINFKGKNLTLRSTDPNNPAVVSETYIIAIDADAVTFSSGEDANCVLAGFTIAFSNNGVYCSGASPTIVNCNIFGNVSTGIKLYMGSNPTISNCIIADNGGSGLAMFTFRTGRYTLVNSPTIVNCTIVGNSEIGISEGKPTILNSIIYGNGVQITGSAAVVTYSNIQGGFPGEGNIDADPFFADPDNGDYHLKSQAGRWDRSSQSWVTDQVTSPCIDAGDPSTPPGSEPSNNGGIINMGAYGGTMEASKSP